MPSSTEPDAPREVVGEQALAEFRQGLTGEALLDELQRHGGRLLVGLPVGVGKSHLLDAATLAALGRYDLVVVLCPTRALLAERRPLLQPPRGVTVVDLRPRPGDDCGSERDGRWSGLEERDLGVLGRATICAACPGRGSCFWPDQYGPALEGARLIYAAQAHLGLAPDFLGYLRDCTGAERMLTLLDEASFVAQSRAVRIGADELDMFLNTLDEVGSLAGPAGRLHVTWRERVALLADASTADLQEDWAFPRVDSTWALAVQQAGQGRHGDAFRFLGRRLAGLGHSPLESRRKADGGGVEFAARPNFPGDLVVFSGTADPVFTAHRMGVPLAAPYAGVRFRHPDTRWLNLASSLGTRRHFPGNSAQILDLFAALTARRQAEGRRVAMVTKKAFARRCRDGLQERLDAAGCGLRVVPASECGPEAVADPAVVPLLTYGAIGVNTYQDFDCLYCLCGYYVEEGTVADCLQDALRADLHVELTVETSGSPRRRRAHAARPEHRFTDVARHAEAARRFLEDDVVLQAVGRVRPFTRPREVITFQMSALPGVAYDAEFANLAGLRKHLGLPTRRQAELAGRVHAVAALRAEGLTQADVATRLGLTSRTVRSLERRAEAETKPVKS
jgi:hypothetical protein